jgi:hypothetical protein
MMRKISVGKAAVCALMHFRQEKPGHVKRCSLGQDLVDVHFSKEWKAVGSSSSFHQRAAARAPFFPFGAPPCFAGLLLLALVMLAGNLDADPVPVRHPQGSAHGFVVLNSMEGKRLATGDMTQSVAGDRVTSRLLLRFRDGSVDDDRTVFTQRGVFRLIRDHHIQRGPSFPKGMDMLIDALTGEITSRGEDGKVRHDHLDLPPDVSNGLPPNLLMNVDPAAKETKLSFVAPAEKPRLIHISIKPAGEVPFTVGSTARKAMDYVLHVELGGVTGIVAPIVGKQPPDFHIWILTGTFPAFIREEGPLYEGGPVWRIEQTSPRFAK